VRTEYSSLLNQINLAPRISFAYRLNNGGQFNLAYGIFYQKPEIIYLVQDNNPAYTRATHYIINYQRKANNRLFRIEAYYKKYKELVTTEPSVANAGSGYAKGIELFFRDKRTFKNFDYWITYTYLDTKRKFLNYPYELQPDFATPHTTSIAIKRFFPGINLSANMSYSLATGRPYYNIRPDVNGKSSIQDRGTTNMYDQMNVSFAYLFTMFKKWKSKDFSGIGFGMNNVLGTKQIFGYNYSYNGLYKIPITQPATRSYYIGLFMTFGIDRRDDFINEKL
jgi:vitamin B12 transporter